jgi:hypothetical protein
MTKTRFLKDNFDLGLGRALIISSGTHRRAGMQSVEMVEVMLTVGKCQRESIQNPQSVTRAEKTGAQHKKELCLLLWCFKKQLSCVVPTRVKEPAVAVLTGHLTT